MSLFLVYVATTHLPSYLYRFVRQLFVGMTDLVILLVIVVVVVLVMMVVVKVVIM